MNAPASASAGSGDAAAHAEQAITARLRDPDYRWWRTQVEATRGCAAPIHLHGSARVLDRDGATLLERSGTVLAPCGNRRESVCPACSDRYCADAFHLLRAGLAGDDTKGVPVTVVEHPRARSSPSPRPRSGRSTPAPSPPAATSAPAPAESATTVTTPASAARSTQTATTTTARCSGRPTPGCCGRASPPTCGAPWPAALGIGARDWPAHGRLSFAKVAEYQRRGLVHFHAVIRLDGPDGPANPPPAGLDHQSLRDAIHTAAQHTLLRAPRPDGEVLELVWGRQLDVRPVTATLARQLEDADTGEMTDEALAGYIAKYATKGTGAHEGVDRPLRDIAHVEHLHLPDHHRRMITTAE
jgi:Replication initiator protein, pSAM2